MSTDQFRRVLSDCDDDLLYFFDLERDGSNLPHRLCAQLEYLDEYIVARARGPVIIPIRGVCRSEHLAGIIEGAFIGVDQDDVEHDLSVGVYERVVEAGWR